MEIKYNPEGIGYHKVRLSSGGQILYDSSGVNTDESGWFALPIEYKLRGFRFYAQNLGVNPPSDITTHPNQYTGYAAGIDVSEYRVYGGAL